MYNTVLYNNTVNNINYNMSAKPGHLLGFAYGQ